MKDRFPIAISSAALVVALLGTTSLGTAANHGVTHLVSAVETSVTGPEAKRKPSVGGDRVDLADRVVRQELSEHRDRLEHRDRPFTLVLP